MIGYNGEVSRISRQNCDLLHIRKLDDGVKLTVTQYDNPLLGVSVVPSVFVRGVSYKLKSCYQMTLAQQVACVRAVAVYVECNGFLVPGAVGVTIENVLHHKDGSIEIMLGASEWL